MASARGQRWDKLKAKKESRRTRGTEELTCASSAIVKNIKKLLCGWIERLKKEQKNRECKIS